MDGYLTKPVRLNDLASSLSSTLRAPTATQVSGPTGLEEIHRRIAELVGDLSPETAKELQQQLLRTFLTQAHDLLAQVTAAISTGELARVAADAHTLTGMSASMGATAFAALARDLERGATTGDAQHLPGTCEALHGQLTALTQAAAAAA